LPNTPGRAAYQVCLDHRQQYRLHGYAAFLATYAFDVDYRGAVVGRADIADVDLAKLVCPRARKECGKNDCKIALGPSRFGVANSGPARQFPAVPRLLRGGGP
jgi:hypothetical protein